MRIRSNLSVKLFALCVGLLCLAAAQSGHSQIPGSKGYLLVTSFDNHSVFRYDAATGAFVDTFIPHKSGGLVQPWGMVVGPHDGQVYVSSGTFTPPSQKKAVLRYDAMTGAFLGDFTESGHLDGPRGNHWPDGHLHVADRSPADNRLGRVVRYHGLTGEFLDQFVPDGFVGRPSGLVFGPKGHGRPGFDLYVASLPTSNIFQYDGATGELIGEFVPSGSGGLSIPGGLVFGPDGNLYVTVLDLGKGDSVLRYQCPRGRSPGAFMDAFVPAVVG